MGFDLNWARKGGHLINCHPRPKRINATEIIVSIATVRELYFALSALLYLPHAFSVAFVCRQVDAAARGKREECRMKDRVREVDVGCMRTVPWRETHELAEGSG